MRLSLTKRIIISVITGLALARLTHLGPANAACKAPALIIACAGVTP
jgi:hypothetical protein